MHSITIWWELLLWTFSYLDTYHFSTWCHLYKKVLLLSIFFWVVNAQAIGPWWYAASINIKRQDYKTNNALHLSLNAYHFPQICIHIYWSFVKESLHSFYVFLGCECLGNLMMMLCCINHYETTRQMLNIYFQIPIIFMQGWSFVEKVFLLFIYFLGCKCFDD